LRSKTKFNIFQWV